MFSLISFNDFPVDEPRVDRNLSRVAYDDAAACPSRIRLGELDDVFANYDVMVACEGIYREYRKSCDLHEN